MFATVRIISAWEHQAANRQYAIGNLLSRTMITCPMVKVTMDAIQDICIPTYANIELCNLVEMNGKYYDILSIDHTSYEAASDVLHIALNPVTTYLKPGATIDGWWERTPSNVKRGGTVQIGDDALALSRRYTLNRISTVQPNFGVPLYVQISSKYDMATKDSSAITLYGSLIQYVPQFMSWPVQGFYRGGSSNFLSLRDIISNLDTLTASGPEPENHGLPADSIIDVSISSRVPWRYTFDGTNFALLDGSGNPVAIRTGTDDRCYYELNGLAVGRASTYSHTIQFSALERYCGKITLVDEGNNDIALIPNQYLDANNQLNLSVETMSDIGGIFTNVTIKGQVYTLQEGHLPWVGDSWNDYKVRMMNYDRTALARGVDTVNQQKSINDINTIGSNLTSMGWASLGGPGVAVASAASMGIGLATNEMQASLDKRNLTAELAEKEGLVKNSAPNNYQTGYGLDYAFKQYQVGGAHIKVELPANLSQADFDNYISFQGWPCKKYASLSVVTGYLKGNIYSQFSGPGPELDMLRRETGEGFRMVAI